MKRTLKSGAFLLSILALMCVVVTSCSSRAESSEKDIISFSIDGNEGIIAEDTKEISVTMPGDTDLQALIPEIVISDYATISPDLEEAVDFTNPVTYVVTAEDGSTQEYVVTVTLLPITSFSLVLKAQLVENGNDEVQAYGIPEDGIYLSTGKGGPSILVISVGGTGGTFDTATVNSEVYWYIDGVKQETNQNIITIKASDYAYTIPHDLTAIVIKDGVKYSKSLTFTVGKDAKPQTAEETGETP